MFVNFQFSIYGFFFFTLKKLFWKIVQQQETKQVYHHQRCDVYKVDAVNAKEFVHCEIDIEIQCRHRDVEDMEREISTGHK